jgi:hypothetical protein
MVAQICNPRTREAEAGSKSGLGYTARPSLEEKKKKKNQNLKK